MSWNSRNLGEISNRAVTVAARAWIDEGWRANKGRGAWAANRVREREWKLSRHPVQVHDPTQLLPNRPDQPPRPRDLFFCFVFRFSREAFPRFCRARDQRASRRGARVGERGDPPRDRRRVSPPPAVPNPPPTASALPGWNHITTPTRTHALPCLPLR